MNISDLTPVELSTGFDASHWGLTDLYPEAEAKLRELLDSGEDFITAWESSKKECLSARYSRTGGEILVEVSQGIDDLWEADDLITDALWSLQHDDEKTLPPEWQDEGYMTDEQIEFIRDIAAEVGIDDHAEERMTLPGNASYDEVMVAVEKLEDMTDEITTEYFKRLKDIVEDSLTLFAPQPDGDEDID